MKEDAIDAVENLLLLPFFMPLATSTADTSKIKAMKKLSLLLLMLFVVKGTTAQWFPMNSGTLNNLYSVYFTDANTGYAVGAGGTILKTYNAGTNWSSLNSGTQYDLSSVHFPVDSTGYAIGPYYYGPIMKTTDAGATWNIVFSSSLSFYSVYFTSADTGYVTSLHDMGAGFVMKTTDGGHTWNYTNVGLQYCVYFPNATSGYSVGVNDLKWSYGTINKTADGGSTWSEVYSIPGTKLTSVYFINSDTGYVVGESGTILKTTDGGVTWENQTSGTSNGLTSVCFTGSDTGYVIGRSGTLLKTTNGGITWADQMSGTIKRLNSIFFTASDTGYVVGDGGTILKTTNGGVVGINHLPYASNPLIIYPVPAYNLITVETTGSGRLSVMDLHGRELYRREITEKSTLINISSFPRGVYFVRVTGERSVQVGKFVKH